MFGKGISMYRLYIDREELGHGLPNARDEYAMELLRTIAHYAWCNDEQIQTIIHQEQGQPHAMSHRMMKAWRKKITREELNTIARKYEDIEEPQKKDLDKFLHEVHKKIEQYYIKQWKEQKLSGELRRQFEQDCVDKKITGEAWRQMNIRREAYLAVTRMQEGATMNGSRKAKITKREADKFCKYCTTRIATNTHILLGCKATKKKQIKQHDYLALQIYKQVESKHNFPHSNPPDHHRTQDKNHLFWNTNVVANLAGRFPKRPDICYKDKEQLLIVDATIVADKNLDKGYISKINKYETLADFFRTATNIRRTNIVPIVMSTNGLIHKKSTEWIKKWRQNINWTVIIRNIIVRNMKTIMYYNGVNIDLQDAEDENT